MDIVLSILVTTLNKRKSLFNRVQKQIQKQITSEVEFLFFCDDGELSVGEKRERLKKASRGKYVCYVDDDDHISKNYISSILEAAKQNSDAIGIRGIYSHDFRDKRKLICSMNYKQWAISESGAVIRPTNHLNPVKRELALQAPFPSFYYGEDRFYTETLKHLVKTETMAEGNLYWYDYRPHNSESIPMDIKDKNKGLKALEAANLK